MKKGFRYGIFSLAIILSMLFMFSINADAKEFKHANFNYEQDKPKLSYNGMTMTMIKDSYERRNLIVNWNENNQIKITINHFDDEILYTDDEIYYIDRDENGKFKIMKLEPESSEPILIKQFSKKYVDDYTVNLIAIKGNKIYYTLHNYEKYYAKMYYLDLVTKKEKKLTDDAADTIVGENRIIYTYTAGDYGPMPLYSIKYDGSAKKKLKYSVLYYKMYGKYLYVFDSDKFRVVKMKEDFSNQKVLLKKVKVDPELLFMPTRITKTKLYYYTYDYVDETTNYYEVSFKNNKVKKLDKLPDWL